MSQPYGAYASQLEAVRHCLNLPAVNILLHTGMILHQYVYPTKLIDVQSLIHSVNKRC